MHRVIKHINPWVVFLHVVFWLTWIISFTIIQSLGKGTHEFFNWLMYYIITLPVFICHTYLIAYWLVPRFFIKRRFLIFTGWLLIFLVFFSALELIVSNELDFKVIDPEKTLGKNYLNPLNIVVSGIGNHYIILVFMAVKAVKSWYEAKNKKEELELLNLETELEIFRYQLKPRFILSMIRELENTTRNDPQKVPELIVKISDFINRLLFEVKAVLIPLDTEIRLIRDFLDIQKVAIGSRLKSNLIINGPTSGRVVPPLLIFPFLIESCKIVNECNEMFDCTVLIKVEKRYQLVSFTLWSENEFAVTENINTELIKKRLFYNYENRFRIIENEDANFREVSIEIFT